MAVTLDEARLYTNHLLARLSDEHLEPLCPMLEQVHTDLKHIAHERGRQLRMCTFRIPRRFPI